MAEGSVEEDSGEMLGPSGVPLMPMHAPSAPTNLSIKDEVSEKKSASMHRSIKLRGL